MAEKVKIPRLGKAASEFNVSTVTIVSFLSKKGFEIKDEPNTKLTEEMYSLLVAEYQKEKDIKEKSSEIDFGSRKAEASEDETASVVKKKERDVEPIASGEIFIKDTGLGRPVVHETRIENVPVEKVRPKVITKIDLGDEKPKRRKPAVKKSEEAKNAEEAKKTEPAPKAEETVTAVEVRTPEEVKPVENIPEEPVRTETAPQEEREPVVEAETNNVPEVTMPEPVQEPAAKPGIASEPEVPVQETPATEEEEVKQEVKEEVFSLAKQMPRPALKTIGHINLDELNQSTKPKRKSQEERKKEREQKRSEQRRKQKAAKAQNNEPKKTETSVAAQSETAPADNFLKTEYTRLAGTKVISHIDLDATKTKREKSESGGQSEEGGKKKRKRIKVGAAGSDKSSGSYGERERAPKSKSKEKKGKYKVDFTEEDIVEQIRKTYSGMAPVKKSQASKHRKEKREHIQHEMMEEMERSEQEKSVLKVTEFITANELAIMMNRPVTDIISVCMSLGLAVAINQRLSAETISLLAENYGYTVQFVGLEEEEEKQEENPEDLVPRAPIITVMGHVDHGKTSLLDYIRNTNVIQGEAGGITQHIGAYEVKVGDKSITFLDTPGHEAFTAMRARGASITDIVIIVIAADDQIMPQTIEAINHAQAAGVPMIFAINKIDKPGADPEKIRAALANMNILVEEWGGKVQSQDISAKKGTNVDLLLEKVLIEAEMLDLKANPKAEPTGTVIESSLDKGRGYVAKILVQNGTLRTGDIIAAGTSYGKIRAMYNEKNQVVKEAGPSVPVLLLGLNSAPQAGDTFKTYKTDKEARAIVNKRSQLLREQGLRTQKHITLDELGRRIAVGDFKELNVIVKGDVDGSIEALSDEILKLSTTDVQVNVIHKSVGQVTESDVLLASASDAIIIAFQVRPSSGAKKLAEQEQVDIRVYSVIYSAIDDLKSAIAGMKAPEIKEQVVANLEVRETFRISKVGLVAGCYVMDGKIQRSSKVRVIRDGIVIHDNGRLGSLKRFKDDAKEVSAGLECGLNIESFNDIVVGDLIEAYEEVEVPVK